MEMNNLYAEWCIKNKQKRVEPFAFKCTAASGGSNYIADLRGLERSHFIATTVDLITTGVDIPILRNVAFFKYVQSPISFQQMMGRGSRIHLPSNKLMFRVYDFTNATRLLGKGFISHPSPTKEPEEPEEEEKEKIIRVEGFNVHVNPAGSYIVTKIGGKLGMVTVEEYSQMIASSLDKEVRSLDDFKERWVDPQKRKNLLQILPDGERGVRLLSHLKNREDYDLYDVLSEIGFGIAPKSRQERIYAFQYKHDAWLKTLPPETKNTLLALAKQFEKGGIQELENRHIFGVLEVVEAGGLEALQILGKPSDIIKETKSRIFAL